MSLTRSFISIFLLTAWSAIFCANAFGENSAKEPAPQPRPMELGRLLNLLPACPDTWIIKRSQARTLYQGNLESYAIREFEEFILPDKSKEKNAPKPETVVMAIRDTCGSGPHIKPFHEETAPMKGGDFKLGNWDRYPAMLVRMGKNRQALRVLVGNRFVVEVVFSGNDLRSLKWWLGRCNLKSLAEAKPRIPITIRNEVMLFFLDELHPERTRNYSVPIEPAKPDSKDLTLKPGKAQEIASE